MTKRILITGGRGFLGQYVGRKFTQIGRESYEIIAPSSRQFDLTEKDDIDQLLRFNRPHMVVHLAAVVGGIQANQKYPGTFLYRNAVMGLELMNLSYRYGVQKFVQIGTVCSYPKFMSGAFKEDDIWNGYPEETNAPYGLAKKLLMVQAQAYRQEFGFNAIYLIPTNLYGPGDNFDPDTSHVIPALIRKFDIAIKNGYTNVEIWGTGNASREFLYVDDAAEAVVLATENYDEAEPVNIGTGQDITILGLAMKIGKMMGYTGNLDFVGGLDGQPRRLLNVERAKQFGFEAKTSLDDGLQKTIDWYQKQGGSCQS